MRLSVAIFFASVFLGNVSGCGDSEPAVSINAPNASESSVDERKSTSPAADDSDPPPVDSHAIVGSGNWTRVDNEADDFTFEMPGTPIRTTQQLPSNFGAIAMVNRVLNRGEMVFTVMTTAYTEEFIRDSNLAPTEILHRGLEAGVRTKPGAILIDRQAVASAGPLTVDQTFSFPDGVNSTGGKYPGGVTFHRATLDGNRLYLMQLDVSQAQYDAHGNAVFDQRRHFFDSFRANDR